jgi:hypothetical protein
MNGSAKVAEIAEGEQRKRWKRQFINEQETPANVIKWRTPREKAKRLASWRDEVGKTFPASGRNLRIAWSLECLFGHDGYAFPTDGYLSRKLGIPVNKIQSGLADLERAGAIVRASVFVRSRPQRRIWPSSKILKVITPTMGGMNTPHDGPCYTPHNGETEYLRRTPSRQNRKISSVADAARKDAERREQAERRRNGAPAHWSPQSDLGEDLSDP